MAELAKRGVDLTTSISLPKPPGGKESNWLQAIPEKSWLIAMDMDGPLQFWIDQNRRPGELKLVEQGNVIRTGGVDCDGVRPSIELSPMN